MSCANCGQSELIISDEPHADLLFSRIDVEEYGIDTYIIYFENDTTAIGFDDYPFKRWQEEFPNRELLFAYVYDPFGIHMLFGYDENEDFFITRYQQGHNPAFDNNYNDFGDINKKSFDINRINDRFVMAGEANNPTDKTLLLFDQFGNINEEFVVGEDAFGPAYLQDGRIFYGKGDNANLRCYYENGDFLRNIDLSDHWSDLSNIQTFTDPQENNLFVIKDQKLVKIKLRTGEITDTTLFNYVPQDITTDENYFSITRLNPFEIVQYDYQTLAEENTQVVRDITFFDLGTSNFHAVGNHQFVLSSNYKGTAQPLILDLEEKEVDYFYEETDNINTDIFSSYNYKDVIHKPPPGFVIPEELDVEAFEIKGLYNHNLFDNGYYTEPAESGVLLESENFVNFGPIDGDNFTTRIYLFSLPSVYPYTEYSFSIITKDGAGRTSWDLPRTSVKTPRMPLDIISITSTSVEFSWTYRDNIGWRGFNVYRNGQKVNTELIETSEGTGSGSTITNIFSISSLDSNIEHTIVVEPIDNEGQPDHLSQEIIVNEA